MPNSLPKFVDLIICDDIRQEIGNKLSLIGIYGSHIIVESFPHRFPKFCVFQKWRDGQGSHTVKIKLYSSTGELIPQEFNFSVQCEPGRGLNILVVIAGLNFEKPGEYSIKTFFNQEKEPTNTYKFKVTEHPKEQTT